MHPIAANTGALTGPLAGLPQRYICEDSSSVFTDGDGFLRAEDSLGLYPLQELFTHWCSLVLAPPWTGKTFVSNALYEALQTGEPVSEGTSFAYKHRTCFEIARAHDELPPAWWDAWKLSDTTACWIIDALDEGECRERGTGTQIVAILKAIDERQRARLRVVIFSRQKGLPEGIADDLDGLRVHQSDFRFCGFRQYQFGPLTRQEAARIVGGDALMDQVVQFIRRHDLQAEARFPKVLVHLSKLLDDAAATTEKIWHDLLAEMIAERNRLRSRPPTQQPEDLFAAAARIAAVLTLTGNEEFTYERSHQSMLSLNDIVPHPPDPGKPNRMAALEVLDTDLFCRTSAGYRFAQKNLQEKMSAFGLKGLKVTALRPLVVDGDGRPAGEHVEMLGFLGVVSEHDKVRKWVDENAGLLKSDAPRLSLAASKDAIDRLMKLAASTPYHLYDIDYKRLAAAGIGAELQKRLRANRRMPPAVVQLLLGIATVTGARDVVRSAIGIALHHPSVDVRRSALTVVLRLGTDDDVRAMEELATRPGKTADRRNLAAAAACGMLDRGIWDIARAAMAALPKTPHCIDSCAMLIEEVKGKATPDDARMVIRRLLRTPDGAILRPEPSPLSLEEPRQEILWAMVERLLGQGQLSSSDIEVLAWSLIAIPYFDLATGLAGTITRKVSASPELRREVFRMGLCASKDTSEERRELFAWHDVLVYEDIDWLIQTAVTMPNCPEFVWTRLLVLAYVAGTGHSDTRIKRREVARVVRQHAPAVLLTFMRKRREYIRREREAQQRVQRRQSQAPRFAIGNLVADVMASSKLSPQQKLWQLSWACFVEPSYRPSNVDGDWASLDACVQQQVLDSCLALMRECRPTNIPDGNTFNRTVLLEASAFLALLRYREPNAWLDRDLVARWLPSVFRACVNDEAWACSKCASVFRPAVQKTALDWLGRNLRQQNPNEHTLPNVPVELWDAGFAEAIAARVQDPHLPVQLRVGLLRALTDADRDLSVLVVKELAASLTGTAADRPLLIAAVDFLLEASPQDGWPIVTNLRERHGREVFLELTFISSGTELGKLDQWSNDQLADLAVRLYADFPSARDQAWNDTFTREDHVRWTRDMIVNVLLERGEAAESALRKVAEAAPSVKNVSNYVWTKRAAAKIVEAAQAHPVVPLNEALRVLDDSNYRLLRKDADLLEVLVETLGEAVARNCGDHVEMLYARKEHLREEALQAYIVCRLQDLLPGKVLHRETKIQRRHRTDLLVEAPTCVDRQLASVVVEVKWSDNKTVRTSLSRQLGHRYLLQEGKRYGIFLVAWCGHLKWPRLKDRTFAGMELALHTQARRFCRQHRGIDVRPVCLDLRWAKPP